MSRSAGRPSAGLIASLVIAPAMPAIAQAPGPGQPPSRPPGTQPPTGAAPSPPTGAAPTLPLTAKPNGSAAPGSPAAPTTARPRRQAGPHRGFRGGIARFSPHELRAWRGGQWRQTWHGGRYGWWWVVDSGWYYYPSPVYPYPDYVAEDY